MRLASVWALAGLGQDRPEALLLISVTRARFCEGLAGAGGQQHRQAEVFLLGMLSLIDTIMGRPMASIIDDLPVSDDVRLALVEHQGPLQPMMECILAYEQGDWEAVEALAGPLGVDPSAIPELYFDSIPADLRMTVGAASD